MTKMMAAAIETNSSLPRSQKSLRCLRRCQGERCGFSCGGSVSLLCLIEVSEKMSIVGMLDWEKKGGVVSAMEEVSHYWVHVSMVMACFTWDSNKMACLRNNLPCLRPGLGIMAACDKGLRNDFR